MNKYVYLLKNGELVFGVVIARDFSVEVVDVVRNFFVVEVCIYDKSNDDLVDCE